jgi:hypothetical protein
MATPFRLVGLHSSQILAGQTILVTGCNNSGIGQETGRVIAL